MLFSFDRQIYQIHRRSNFFPSFSMIVRVFLSFLIFFHPFSFSSFCRPALRRSSMLRRRLASPVTAWGRACLQLRARTGSRSSHPIRRSSAFFPTGTVAFAAPRRFPTSCVRNEYRFLSNFVIFDFLTLLFFFFFYLTAGNKTVSGELELRTTKIEGFDYEEIEKVGADALQALKAYEEQV